MILPIIALVLGQLLVFIRALPLGDPTLEPDKRQIVGVISSCTVPNTVALTFDNGPYIWLKDISDTLTTAGAKGTFFFNGNNWRCIYDPQGVASVKYAFSQGHQVASHTWSHANLATLTGDTLINEFARLDQALMRIVGVTPAFMRPPYGSVNDAVIQVANSRNEKVILWDFDSGDSRGSTAAQSKQAYQDFVNTQPSTILTLNHETYYTTVFEVLPFAIKLLQDNGYKLVTVADCLGMQPYQKVGDPQNGSWSCDSPF